MNKKRWILVIIVVGVVVFASLLFALVKRPILSIGVDKVIIKTYSHSNTPGITEVELEPGEAGKAILLYNLGGVGFNINAEPCCASYWIEVHYNNGKHIKIAEGTTDSMIVTPTVGERYCVKSNGLIDYVKELVDKYDMVCD